MRVLREVAPAEANAGRGEVVTLPVAPRAARPHRASRTSFPTEFITGVFICCDMLAILPAAIIAFALMRPLVPMPAASIVPFWLVLIPLVAASASHMRLYDPPFLFRAGDQLGKLAKAAPLILTVAALVAWIAFGTLGFALLWAVAFLAIYGSLVAASRFIVCRRMQTLVEAGWIERAVVVVGAGPHGAELLRTLEPLRQPWTRILGVFDDRAGTRVPASIAGHPVLGTTAELPDFARQTRIDEIVIAMPWSAQARMREILTRVNVVPANIHIGPDLLMYDLPAHKLVDFYGMPAINVVEKPLNPWNWLVKSIEDKVVAVIALILLAPLLAAVALAIKLDSPGPVLFRQKRFGFNNDLIEVFKFRSMHHHMADAAAAQLTTRDDPRVTRIGRFLRRSSLDEMPQLFNVLRGEMSIVGPRPHALQAKADGRLYQDVVDNYALRHKIKPGITGWAQINGWRGETDTFEKIINRVNHDLYYIDNWSLILDLYIILSTPIALVRTKNAY